MVDALQWWDAEPSARWAGESTLSIDVPDDLLPLLGHLARTLGVRRRGLLALRARRQERADAGEMPAPRANTRWVRRGAWTCTASTAHTEVLVARGLSHTDARVVTEGDPISATLLDLATHLHARARAAGPAPCVCVPEIAGLEEAFWLRDALDALERALGLPKNTVRVAVAVETVPAAFEAHEILFALRHRAVSLQSSPTTYTRTLLELSRARPERALPDVAALTVGQPWLEALLDHLTQVVTRRRVTPLGWLRSVPPTADPDAVMHLLDLPNGPRTLSGVRRLVHTTVLTLASASVASPDQEATLGCAVLRHWVRHAAPLDDGRPVSIGLIADALADAHLALHGTPGADRAVQQFREAVMVAP